MTCGLLVFDFDGVIINSEALMRLAFREALAGCGAAARISVEDFLQCMGMPLPQIARRLGLPPSFVPLYQRVSRERMDLVETYDGASAMLAAARRAARCVALMTGKDRCRTTLLLERLRLLSAFDGVICGDDPCRGKPAPDGLWELMRRLRVSAADTVMVGDSAIDIQCGRASGALTVGAGWGFSAPHALQAAGATWVFESPAALTTWLSQRGSRELPQRRFVEERGERTGTHG